MWLYALKNKQRKNSYVGDVKAIPWIAEERVCEREREGERSGSDPIQVAVAAIILNQCKTKTQHGNKRHDGTYFTYTHRTGNGWAHSNKSCLCQ